MMRTAVVLVFTMPMAASSAMMAEMVAAEVSPGTAIMSSPTEQTQVMASSLSRHSVPPLGGGDHALVLADTGINAPDRPPTWEDAMTPPFFTASFSMARAAVVPWVPQTSSPISSRIRATLSPTAGVGAKAQIHDAEGYAQTAGGFLRHQLTHAGNLEGGLFDGLGHHVKGLTLHVLQSVVHHAGAGNAHIDARTPARPRRGTHRP